MDGATVARLGPQCYTVFVFVISCNVPRFWRQGRTSAARCTAEGAITGRGMEAKDNSIVITCGSGAMMNQNGATKCG